MDTWTDFATAWADIQNLTGHELIAGQAVSNESRFNVTTRYVSGLTPAMRIVFGTRTFNILDVHNVDERNRRVQIVCQEGLAEG